MPFFKPLFFRWIVRFRSPFHPDIARHDFAAMPLSDASCLILYYGDKSNARRRTSCNKVAAFIGAPSAGFPLQVASVTMPRRPSANWSECNCEKMAGEWPLPFFFRANDCAPCFPPEKRVSNCDREIRLKWRGSVYSAAEDNWFRSPFCPGLRLSSCFPIVPRALANFYFVFPFSASTSLRRFAVIGVRETLRQELEEIRYV